MFSEKIIEFLQKNPNFKLYEEVYKRHTNHPYISKLLERYIEDCIFGLLYSAIEKDEPSLAREAALLTDGLQNLNPAIN